jgi:hypothetical protein
MYVTRGLWIHQPLPLIQRTSGHVGPVGHVSLWSGNFNSTLHSACVGCPVQPCRILTSIDLSY